MRFRGAGEEILEAARQHGLEGVVAKRADSFYEPKRSRDWLKIKLVNEDDFVICGFLQKEARLLWVADSGTRSGG